MKIGCSGGWSMKIGCNNGGWTASLVLVQLIWLHRGWIFSWTASSMKIGCSAVMGGGDGSPQMVSGYRVMGLDDGNCRGGWSMKIGCSCGGWTAIDACSTYMVSGHGGWAGSP
ncbi:hypothetical protein L6452_15389 [Arctium lappa]|uniref:Uncharacterized protein n=1 Tax=Arctium lappa TaxID=4217 RepID=A0ACB9CNR5_ARCLA|nr:hypothetical protein L6452_15389 [Arctium lappa]